MKLSRFTSYRILTELSKLLSTVLNPMLMPTYGTAIALWLSYLNAATVGGRVTILMMIFGITCILPMILISVLHHFQVIKDKRLERQSDRLIPYLFAILCYGAAVLYLLQCHAPRWFIMFGLGAMLTVIVCVVVNHWWKISAHLAGIGGLTALIYEIHVLGISALTGSAHFTLFCVTVLLAGALGTARLTLRRHTLSQVLCGFLVGFISVALIMRLFG